MKERSGRIIGTRYALLLLCNLSLQRGILTTERLAAWGQWRRTAGGLSMTDQRDLHGNAPDKSPVALLLIDVINDLEFPDGEQLFRFALPMARQIAELKRQAAARGIPAIYVNDNFGRWQSDFNTQVRHCLQDGVRGQPLVELLQPASQDYFILKPKHSGFYDTTLETLLEHLQCRTLILTGMATNICVLFTANDAYMREFQLIVPADCVAANTAEENKLALDQMRRVLKADIRPWAELDLQELLSRSVQAS